MYNGVLMPTDGSEVAEKAFEHAVHIARTNDATLHVIHVVDPSSLPSSAGSLRLEEQLEEIGREGIVENLIQRAEAEDISVEGDVLRGTPHDAILEYAEDHDIDFIAMGTHGRHGLDRYIIGSTAERVVRDSPIPVLTVRYMKATDADE